MRGRKPLPTSVKLLRGNPGKRALNHSEPQPRRSLPRAPRWLDNDAKMEWRRTSKLLHEMGVLTQIDRNALAVYCECYSTWKQAREQLANEGLTMTGAKGQPIKNPLLTIIEKAREQMKQYAAEFGMTPSSRSRLKVNEKSEEDPFEEWVKEKLG